MKAYTEAKITMSQSVKTHCGDNPAIVAASAAFQEDVTDFNAKLGEVVAVEQILSLSSAGVTETKADSKKNMCVEAADLGTLLYGLGSKTGNMTLKQAVNISVTEFMKTKDEQLAPLCQAIHDLGVENKDALAPYNVTTASLEHLQTLIDNYSEISPKPRAARGNIKTLNNNLEQLVKELMEILTERMDKSVISLKKTHPDFVQTYFNLRKIPDPPTTHTQLKGIITDAADGSPIKGATITIVELGKTAKTDSSGEYSFKPVKNGKCTVRITKDGYVSYENDEVEIKMGDILHLDVALEADN